MEVAFYVGQEVLPVPRRGMYRVWSGRPRQPAVVWVIGTVGSERMKKERLLPAQWSLRERGMAGNALVGRRHCARVHGR